ncbi:unnamed protein product [Agarophyton chilense]
MVRLRFIAVLAALAIFVSAVAEDDVLVGNKDNFESLIGAEELTLVKFFAPWCGHCKKMADDFKQAATVLKGKAQLVDLDATEEKDLAQKYGVRGFPTLKLFSKGELISDYKGGRTKDDIVKYIERALLPSVTHCADAEALSTFVSENKGKSLAISVKADKLESEFKKASMSLRDVMPDSIAFASVDDAALVKDLAGKDVDDDIVLLVREDKSSDSFSGTPEDVGGWLKFGAIPLFSELSRETASLYTELDNPIFLLFQDPDKKDKDVNEVITEIAKTNRGDGSLVFAWINAVELKSFAEHIGVSEKDPAIAIYEFKSDQKYIFSDDYSKEALTSWVAKFVKGEVNPSKKSEPVPESNDDPVKVVVGDSWADIVEDEGKDVLIEQYAPWCGHCKKLAPVLDELAADLKGVSTLVIAKMDATLNDAPKGYKAQGFPTLHFFKAGSKEGVAYDGGRSKEDFIKFFQENATHKEGLEVTKSDDKEEEKEEQ